MMTEQANFNVLEIDQIQKGLDCHIDDPQLLDVKKHLQGKFTPVQVVNTIVSKFP